MTRTRRFIIWEGASVLDGRPIALLATLGAKQRANSKTGRMWQTYILRQDLDPVEAAQTGKDASICGGCPHKLRSQGTCYVRLDTGPRNVFKSYKRGGYARRTLEQSRALFAGQLVRMGAYGDPCAVPFEVWASIMADTSGHTGYTHQWKAARFHPFASLVMASCDNALEDRQARGLGWRTFTVLPSEAKTTPEGSFLCPASKQAGHKLTCAECLACDGNASKRKASVYTPVHGVAFKVQRFDSLLTIGRVTWTSIANV